MPLLKGEVKLGQYFTNDPKVKSRRKLISFNFFGEQFDFLSDNGVFSKSEIDDGSVVFLKTIIKNRTLQGKILDLGSGYGTIGLILAFFNRAEDFLLADVNSRACVLARENVKRFNLSNVEVRESDCFSNITEMFDFILINPPIRAGKKVIYKMFSEAYEHLDINGKLLIVIRKNQGAETASKYIQSVFGNCTLLDRDKGYHVYEAIKVLNKANTEK